MITAKHFQMGALWTFVHRDGTETEYVYDHLMASGAGGLSGLHALANPSTGKFAQVTEKWLREGPVGDFPHWLPKAEAQAEAA